MAVALMTGAKKLLDWKSAPPIPILLALAFSFPTAAAQAAPTITTYAGGGNWQASPPLSIATSAYRVAIGPDGATYVADSQISEYTGSYVYRIDPLTYTITRVVGTGVAGYTGDGGPAGTATLNRPSGLAFDAQGNLYIADRGNDAVRRVAAPVSASSTITSIPLGYSVGHAVNAPTALAIDRTGTHLYVAGTDSSSNTNVQVLAVINVSSGTPSAPTLITGNCYPPACVTANGAPAITSNISIDAIAVDADNNVYLAPVNGGVIDAGLVYVDAATLTLHVVVSLGVGNQIGCRSSGPITGANMIIADLAFEATGNLLIADSYSNLVCRAILDNSSNTAVVDAGSQLVPVAGNSNTQVGELVPFGAPAAGDGGPAISSQLYGTLSGLAIDDTGNVVVADNLRVREITVDAGGLIANDSLIKTAAGGYDAVDFSGDGNPATASTFEQVHGIATDSRGTLYLGDTQVLRRVDPTSKIITSIAGDNYGADGLFSPSCPPDSGFGTGDGGPALCASIGDLDAVAVDFAGNVFFTNNSTSVRKVSPTGIISTLASSAVNYTGSGIAVDSADNVYVTDTSDNLVKMISPQGVVTTIAGNGVQTTVVCSSGACPGDGGPGVNAPLYHPYGIAIASNGDIYFTDNNAVRKLNLSTCAGNLSACIISSAYVFPPTDIYGITYPVKGSICDNPASASDTCVHVPEGIGFDAAGNLFVADAAHYNAIVELNPNVSNTIFTASTVTQAGPAQQVNTPGGSFLFSFGGDGGPPSSGRVNNPLGIAVDLLGNLYVADSGNDRIRLITGVAVARGDINGDGQVDKADLAQITSALNKPASGPNDMRDLNHDGVINALDSRILVTLCTHPGCATH